MRIESFQEIKVSCLSCYISLVIEKPEEIHERSVMPDESRPHFCCPSCGYENDMTDHRTHRR